MTTVFIVQGEHHFVPGPMREVFSNKAEAEKSALDMVNTIRADVVDDDTDECLPPWSGDWKLGLDDTRRRLGASPLYTGNEIDVWIDEEPVPLTASARTELLH